LRRKGVKKKKRVLKQRKKVQFDEEAIEKQQKESRA
jgi:hypothetical protein